MQKQSKFIESEHQPLKQVYPELQKRKYFVTKKLKDCPLKNPFVLRIEPMQKHFHQKEKIKYITLIAEGSTLMAQINANVHKKLGLTSSMALFLVCGYELVCNRKTVVQMTEKNKDQDGILYIWYADQDPFGRVKAENEENEEFQQNNTIGKQRSMKQNHKE